MDQRDVLAGVAPRLRALRQQRGLTLAALAETTGISVSTLSRLESGGRRPALDLLLPIARAYRVPLDDLVGAPAPEDPRVRIRPFRRGRLTFVPLTRRPDAPPAYKVLVPGSAAHEPIEQGVHDGHDWLYVLAGRLRLALGDDELVLEPGEAAEFDTRVPHGFASAGPEPVELISVFGPSGERMHVRA